MHLLTDFLELLANFPLINHLERLKFALNSFKRVNRKIPFSNEQTAAAQTT